MLFIELHVATLNDKIEIVEILLDAGCNVNQRNNVGETCLLVALKSEIVSQSLVKLLIERGADIFVKNIYGAGVLQYSSWSGQISLCKQFMEAGVELSPEDFERHYFYLCSKCHQCPTGIMYCKNSKTFCQKCVPHGVTTSSAVKKPQWVANFEYLQANFL